MSRDNAVLLSYSIVLLFGLLTNSAVAEFIEFFGRDEVPFSYSMSEVAEGEFISHLPSVVTEDFEFFQLDAAPPLSLPFGVNAGVSLTGTAGNFIADDTSGNPPHSGERMLLHSPGQVNDMADDIVLSFSALQKAIGFYVFDVGDVTDRIDITLSSPTMSTTISTPSVSGDNLAFYWGVIATDESMRFDEVTIAGAAANDGFSIDDISVTEIPEPSAVVLAILGLVFLKVCWIGRRRTAAAVER